MKALEAKNRPNMSTFCENLCSETMYINISVFAFCLVAMVDSTIEFAGIYGVFLHVNEEVVPKHCKIQHF